MAPSRGEYREVEDDNSHTTIDNASTSEETPSNDGPSGPPPVGNEPSTAMLRRNAEKPQFTLRAILCGTLIGVLISFSNTYFGLQTGWISGMAMPSALIGFAAFKGLNTFREHLGMKHSILSNMMGKDFSEVENVLVQTVSGSVGTMPLGCGFVGVMPALEFLLHPDEIPGSDGGSHGDGSAFVAPKPHLNPDLADLAHANPAGGQNEVQKETTNKGDILQTRNSVMLEKSAAAPMRRLYETGLHLETWRLVLWALGLCLFGVILAVPLRKEVIVREKLRFPSGTATALVIGVLHGSNTGDSGQDTVNANDNYSRDMDDEQQGLLADHSAISDTAEHQHYEEEAGGNDRETAMKRDWKNQIRLLSSCFAISGLYTLISYFIPQLHDIPLLGTYLSDKWLWNLNPSPAYVGQGIIMGPATTLHMLFGALLGWAVLSPIAKYQGWAPGDVGDWERGSKGWIVWVSLAIMLADAIVSLGWLVLRPSIWYGRQYVPGFVRGCKEKGLRRHLEDLRNPQSRGYSAVSLNEGSTNGNNGKSKPTAPDSEPEFDAPPHHLIGAKTTVTLLVLSLAFCVVAVRVSFNAVLSVGLTAYALILAALLAIMGVRALGETDLNPVSGISKLTQLLFAFATPPGTKNRVVINLLAGAISEAGALQAGDLLQDLKTGHLLGASPKAQFYGQLIGSCIGAVISALVYRLYTNVYRIPGGLFQVPTGFVWVFTARLVTGSGLPPRTAVFAFAAAAIWAVVTVLRIYGNTLRRAAENKENVGFWESGAWTNWLPGGIAVAVGMYNTPSFTLARTAGGVLCWWWVQWKGRPETPVIVLASGLILGEGLVSIVNLGLASGGVPHL